MVKMDSIQISCVNRFALLLVTILFLVVPCAVNAAAKNESLIQVSPKTKIRADEMREFDKNGEIVANTSAVRWCEGAVPGDVDLSKAGLSADDLKAGVSCLTGDFDGNGYLDFVLYQKPPAPDGKWHSRNALALFYKGSAVIKSQVTLPLALFQENDRERKNYPQYKNRAGLIKRAGGDSGMVYFYSSGSGQFEKVPYVYPKGYEMGE